MIRFKASAAAAVITAILLFPLPPASASDEILTSIQKRYANLDSLTADYVRVTSTPAMEGVFQSSAKHTAAGRLFYRKPAKLILDQSAPRAEKMVTNGDTVWWFIQDENVVHRYSNVDVYTELKPLLDFLGGLGSLAGRFAVKVTPAGTPPNVNHRLDLSRLQEGSGPTGITVWLAPQDFTLVGFKLTSLTGETTVFTLTGVRLNPKLDDRAFVFEIPAGTKVIEEARGQM
ncbi:MAG: outer membrane lipoprotein carrier protein LolA [Thermodesulfobacteriota bacterium]